MKIHALLLSSLLGIAVTLAGAMVLAQSAGASTSQEAPRDP
jgi:hypothetical protein